jgi:hypothetical protein
MYLVIEFFFNSNYPSLDRSVERGGNDSRNIERNVMDSNRSNDFKSRQSLGNNLNNNSDRLNTNPMSLMSLPNNRFNNNSNSAPPKPQSVPKYANSDAKNFFNIFGKGYKSNFIILKLTV